MSVYWFNRGYGALWGLACVGNATVLYEDAKKYFELKNQNFQKKVDAIKKRLLIDSISFWATGAFSASWANQVQWIRLGKALPYVSGFAHSATLTVSGLEISQDVKDLHRYLFSRERPHHLSLACLKTAAHLSAVAWAVFGIVSLVLGAMIFPKAAFILLLVYLSFSTAVVAYKIHYDIKE
jgi:hypothetical protein